MVRGCIYMLSCGRYSKVGTLRDVPICIMTIRDYFPRCRSAFIFEVNDHRGAYKDLVDWMQREGYLRDDSGIMHPNVDKAEILDYMHTLMVVYGNLRRIYVIRPKPKTIIGAIGKLFSDIVSRTRSVIYM